MNSPARPPAYCAKARLAAELDMSEDMVDQLVLDRVLPSPETDPVTKDKIWSWSEVETAIRSIRTGTMQGTIYFVGFANYVKIGFTAGDLRLRLVALQTGSPEKLEVYVTFNGTMADERRLHKQFAERRLNGEWFRRCAEIEEFIAGAR